MFWNKALASAAVISGACAEIRPLAMDPVIQVRASDVLELHYSDVADRYLSKRQEVNPDSQVALNPDGTMDMEAWEEETTSACRDALAHLNVASNPSGTGICYNLPALDPTSGVFEADLRLFKVSEPSGQFQGIPPESIEVGLSFAGASVSPVEASRISGAVGQQRKAKRADVMDLLQSYMFVGQINPSNMQEKMTMAELEALVLPVLTLTATNTTGQRISTNVSSNEAAFLTGVFSREVVMSEFATAKEAVSNITAELRNGTVAFVLPGVQIMIFPIGLIITGIWTLVGFLAYGIGTYDRVSYAESFKRRSAIASNTKRQI
ncbi:hypothetical protein VD0002_g290 [Verticillium dahliae]|uniref:Uncharacterized protein n=2 Tax=Verticillium dahliae TaxID=27337 RepID=G2XDG1_VERDV|nr:uncharacterized protein VDAG_08193 [Verticillium dahliae VdLs.17]KAF3347766.1 Putative pectin lyase F-1 [Verticillium dahliae VDG2]KAF3356310.1 FACT complex subunit SPT16 [Verticillium dahliae VDG1]KAH6696093.1 hypothetical protein EV126DRAFT_68037 [Verticillium dahliae]EGY17029.1 hypothetical protein VDAG_08193 [Verticillium dahliae VdLs.17]PNH31305.1 hypothetical protein BJF96_g5528 [Verticillium dahliae]